MDEMIYKTQVWLNETYGGKTGYKALNLNNDKIAGRTNWTTIYALTRALQIELGITSTADNFGNTTIAKFKSRFPNGISQQAEENTEEDNIYAIIQGALWCKGYSAVYGAITKQFKSSVASSIKKMKADAGLSNANATISVDLMKALLSMDQFVLLSSYGGTSEIRTIQQTLNGNYANYVGIIPCDGVYGRSLNKAYTIDVGLESVSSMMGLVSTIKNGTIAIRAGMDSTGCFVTKYEVEQIVREDDDTKYYQYYEVECKFKPYEKDNTSTQPEYSFEKAYDIQEWVEAGIKIAAVVLIITAVVSTVATSGAAAPAAASIIGTVANLQFAH